VAWDVDHTLVENSGVSKLVYASAYRKLTGADPEFPPQTEGRTDRAIMRLLFALHGRKPPPWQVIDRMLTSSGMDHQSLLSRIGFPLPGAVSALRRISREAGIVQTVLTGNIRTNAQLKLAVFRLEGWLDLDVGAYGSDGTDRADLVPLVQQRAGSKYGPGFDLLNTTIIGDTPRDVEAGRSGGARVVAVASGQYSVLQLRRAGASIVLPNLLDTDLLLRAVTSAEGDVLSPPGRP